MDYSCSAGCSLAANAAGMGTASSSASDGAVGYGVADGEVWIVWVEVANGRDTDLQPANAAGSADTEPREGATIPANVQDREMKLRIASYWLAAIVLIASYFLTLATLATGQGFDDLPQTKLVQFDINDAVEQYATSICRIKAGPYPVTNQSGIQSQGWSIGTGVYIGNKWCLTASHVVSSHDCVVQFKTEQIRVVDRWHDQYADSSLILLEKEPQSAVAIPVARTEPVGLVVLAGFDHGNTKRLRIFTGEVWRSGSDSRGATQWFRPVRARAAISGNSGGPVINSAGQLVCNLHSTAMDGSGTIGYPNSQLVSFINRASEKHGSAIVNWTEQQQEIVYDWGGGNWDTSPGPQFVGRDCDPRQVVPSPGSPGRDGVDGRDGSPGRDGVDGKNGSPGRDGVDGKDGRTPTREELVELIKEVCPDCNKEPEPTDEPVGSPNPVYFSISPRR